MNVDTLHALVLILHAKVARDGFPIRYAIRRNDEMTPNMQGLAARMKTLRHNLETQAQSISVRADSIETRGATAMKEAATNLDATEAVVKDIEDLNASLKGSNGGPTLDGSQQISGEPAASWSGNKPA